MPTEPFDIKVFRQSRDLFDGTLFSKLPPLPQVREEAIDDDILAYDPPIKISPREEVMWRRTSAEIHDRSYHLFLLAVILKQHGLRNDLIKAAIAKHPLSIDKYFGRTQKEAERIVEKLNTEPVDEVVIDHIISWNWLDFMSKPTAVEWAIRDSWIKSSVGFVSGRAKTYKSWLTLDIAMSMMTGSRFLDTYQTMETGPVLLIQEEDPHAVIQERLRLIAEHKGLPASEMRLRGGSRFLSLPNLPFQIFNLQGFKLEDDGKVGQIAQAIRMMQPSLVILDPFINLISSEQTDEYKGSAIANALQTFKHWREDFGCGVLVVHHWNKGSDNERGGESMYGSFAFHAWMESALHVRAEVEENEQIKEVTVEREFKAAPSGSRFKIEWDIQTERPGSSLYRPNVGTQVTTKKDEVFEIVELHPGESLKQLAVTTGYTTKQLQGMLASHLRERTIVAVTEGKDVFYHIPES